MGREVDTFGAYVESRLAAWAREIRGGGENLSFPPINHICVTNRVEGRAPILSELGWQTECVVVEIGKDSPDSAATLRACYLGRGSWRDDRRELLGRMLGKTISRRRFWIMYQTAFEEARNFFDALAKIG